jgi:hypothetical protein
MNQPQRPETQDCGGDCLKCVAGCDDPECIETLNELENPETRSLAISRYEEWRIKFADRK